MLISISLLVRSRSMLSSLERLGVASEMKTPCLRHALTEQHVADAVHVHRDGTRLF